MRKLLPLFLCLLAFNLALSPARPTAAQDTGEVKPFGLPFAEPPGPSTWILI